MGLGLSMVNGLAEQSGGRLVLKSRVGDAAHVESPGHLSEDASRGAGWET